LDVYIIFIGFSIGKNMSMELQERADRITKELKEALIPLRIAIQKLKENSYPNNSKIAK
jgi:hypothetical protein